MPSETRSLGVFRTMAKKGKRPKAAKATAASVVANEPLVLSHELTRTGCGAFGVAVSRRGKLSAIGSLGMKHDGRGRFHIQIIVVPIRRAISN